MKCLIAAASGDLGVASVERAVAWQTAAPTWIAVADEASAEVASVIGSPVHATVG